MGGAALAVLAGVAVLGAGCGVSPGEFAGKADRTCATAARRLAGKAVPTTASRGIDYAIDVVQEKDRLLLQLRELRLPDGDADMLRDRWLDPARRDLENALPRLDAIRAASRAGDLDALAPHLEAVRRAGTAGVDVAMLADYGLDRCASLFDPAASAAPDRH